MEKKSNPYLKLKCKQKKLLGNFLVAKKNIKKGEQFNLDNLTSKRTGMGIDAFHFRKILARKPKKNYFKYQVIFECEI